MGSSRTYDRHGGKTAPPPVFGIGCLYTILGFALPVLVMAVSIGAFALIWWLKGDPHRAGRGSAGIAVYGMLALVPFYVLYAIGYVAARAVPRPRLMRGLAAGVTALALALAVGMLALALGSLAVAVYLAVVVGVLLLGGVVSLAARAAARAADQ